MTSRSVVMSSRSKDSWRGFASSCRTWSNTKDGIAPPLDPDILPAPRNRLNPEMRHENCVLSRPRGVRVEETDWTDLPGRLIVLSGASGSGKSTLVKRLLGRPDLKLQVSVSATTR